MFENLRAGWRIRGDQLCEPAKTSPNFLQRRSFYLHLVWNSVANRAFELHPTALKKAVYPPYCTLNVPVHQPFT
jgi:hypothetical protein